MKKTMATAAAITAAGLISVTAGAANAAGDYQWIRDQAGDGAGRLGVTYVKVSSTDRQFRVFTRHQDLRARSGGGMTILLDTRPGNPGPEYRVSAGLANGTDYYLTRIGGDMPLRCDLDLRLDYAGDTARTAIPKRCLKSPAKLRARVRVSHNGSTDLAPGRGFMNWVNA